MPRRTLTVPLLALASILACDREVPSSPMANPAFDHTPDHVQLVHLANLPLPPGAQGGDIAFEGRLAVQGLVGYGFRLVDLNSNRVVSTVRCSGATGSVSMAGALLFLSLESPICEDVPAFGIAAVTLAGIGVYEVEKPESPTLLGILPTPCGSKQHTAAIDIAEALMEIYSLAPRGTTCEDKYDFFVLDVINPDGIVIEKSKLGVPLPGGEICGDLAVHRSIHRMIALCDDLAHVLDASDPENLTILSSRGRTSGTWESAAFSHEGGLLSLGDDGGRVHYFIGDDISGTPLGTFSSTGGSCAGGFLPGTDPFWQTLGCSDKGTNVVSIGLQSTNSVMIGTPAVHSPDDANVWDSYWYNGRVYASDISGGFDVFSVPGGRFRNGRNPGSGEPVKLFGRNPRSVPVL